MKVLSVRQPWASLIALGRKRVELRVWSTDYRGALLIVSARGAIHEAPSWVKVPHDLPRGVALSVVQLVDVTVTTSKDGRAACRDLRSYVGRPLYSWHLEKPVGVRPVSVMGQLSLFSLPPDTLKEILRR